MSIGTLENVIDRGELVHVESGASRLLPLWGLLEWLRMVASCSNGEESSMHEDWMLIS